MEKLLETEIRKKERWLVIPSKGGIAMLSGYYTEEEVMNFTQTKLMMNIKDPMSFTVQKTIAAIYRHYADSPIPNQKNLFDIDRGKSLFYAETAGVASFYVSVKEPFWMVQGSESNGTGTLTVKTIGGKTIEIICCPNGKNEYGRVLFSNFPGTEENNNVI